MATPGYKDGAGFVHIYICTGPIWSGGCHKTPAQKGLGSEGGRQQAEKHPTAEPQGLRSKAQGTSPFPASATASQQASVSPLHSGISFWSPGRDQALEVWVNPWDGKVLLIKIINSS